MSSSAWHRSKRLAASVWMPWTLGVVTLLGLAGSAASLGGRVDGGPVVPTAVLDAQQASTENAAQQVRRSLNAGLQGLDQLAAGLNLAERPGRLEGHLSDFARRYPRYRSVYLLDARHQVVYRSGGNAHPTTVPEHAQHPGMTDAVKIESIPVVTQYVPVRLQDSRKFTLAAEYDASRLRSALSGIRPGTAWVVNTAGQVVASTSGFTALDNLYQADLRSAASAAHGGSGVATVGGSQAAKDIVAHTPVRGDGRTSALGWGVVTSRSVDTVALPQIQARREALLFSLVLATLAVVTFGWLVMLLYPLRRLVGEAQRLAGGDLSEPVEMRRHDEIGLIARALERLRVRVIRETTRQHPPPASRVDTGPAAPAPVTSASSAAGAGEN